MVHHRLADNIGVGLIESLFSEIWYWHEISTNSFTTSMTKLGHFEHESRMLDPASSGEDSLDVGKNEFIMIPELTTVSQELIESQGYFGVYLAGVILIALFVSIPLGLFIFRK